VVAHLAERGRDALLLDRPVSGPPRADSRDRTLARLAEAEPEAIELAPLLAQLAQGVAGGGSLIAVLTVPDGPELRQLVRAGRGFSTRAALLVDADSHTRKGRRDPDATAAALRAAGWRVTVLRAGDRLPERWRELVTQRRAAAMAAAGAPR
jgi:hypothetical protein